MKYKKLVYILFISLFIVGCQSETSKANSVEEYIPSRLMNAEVTADIMTLEFPYGIKEKLEKIGNKMSTSITNNLDWYFKYAEEMMPNGNLPYHENFGITKEEYDFMIDEMNKAKYVNTSDGKIFFKKKGHEIQIRSDEHLKLVENISIDTEKNVIKTAFGECEYDGEIQASDGQKLISPWNGKRWVLKKDGLIYRFSLGKLVNTNKSIIYITIKGIYKEKIINTEEVVEFHSVS
ncbi:hypothetical protein [Bacillus mycoides]|uniref:hypothetical protein n=1 Tax=Bacillus mycoides TaxID=1405 RepID=UPI00077AD03E|nr:hypothetical protein [Bacillus mycoides]KXY46800.1 hypothetical protein AT257_14735 [Bacillus cereus]QEL83228.1 hypothetical protein DN409_01930 [Bacillus mycoides]